MAGSKLTEHFSLEEFRCRDGTPYPAQWIDSRLQPLCAVLEVIRAEFDRPLIVNSGYRTEEYNRRIGGARLSQHVQGRAADIRVGGINPARVLARVLQLYNDGLILIGGLGDYPTFTHVDIRPVNRLARWSGSRPEN
jgi:uncharacterized protein YcbK (DUF882 family)